MDAEQLALLATRLREIDDTSLRAKEATQLLDLLAKVQVEIKEQRRADVTELRQTLKLREVAELLGMSTARVDQIAKGSGKRVAVAEGASAE